MKNRIVLVKSKTYAELTYAEQNFMESAFGSLPGTRLSHSDDFLDALQSVAQKTALIVYPILLPLFENDCISLLKTIERCKPFANVFAMQFLLFADRPEFDPSSFSEDFWIDALDRFYDVAVPIQFVVCYQDATNVVQFHMRASANSLFREMDNLAELKKIEATLKDFELQIKAFERLV